ncbi:MAG: Fe-S cluster assembly protein SufD [Flavobacteriales bacterium]|nr:Fe-S cluster assembly protein SufD [Flavobacteriales bacterium]
METMTNTTKENQLIQSLKSSYSSPVAKTFMRIQNESAARLNDLTFPNSRVEYWKYTRTGQIANKMWAFSTQKEAEIPENLPVSKYRMVFVNGYFNQEKSILPEIEGLSIRPFSESSLDQKIAQGDDDIFKALNTAMPQDGYIIHLIRDVIVEDPIQMVFLYEGNLTIVQPRSFVKLESGSGLKVSEFHIHANGSRVFANIHSEVSVHNNAHYKIDIVQQGSEHGFHLHETFGEQDKNCTYSQNTFTLSGNWTRNNSTIRLTGEHSECNINGFYIPNLKEHIDNHTIIDHEKPNCESNELYRGVLIDKSTGVFNGKVFVRQDAQKTNAFQSNGNIIFSDTATMNSKPELEIYADDVKCSHGSTTGQLDDEAIFYLMARGLSRESARKLLINAFAEDVLEKLVNENLRPIIEETINTKLA